MRRCYSILLWLLLLSGIVFAADTPQLSSATDLPAPEQHTATAGEWNRRGFRLYREQHFAEALAAYQQAVALDPGLAVGYNNLGAACLGLGDYSGGERAFRKALQLDSSYVKAAYNLAVALYRQNRYLDAYRAYRQAKAIDAKYVRQRLDKGKARDDLQRKLQDDPNNELLLAALKHLDDE